MCLLRAEGFVGEDEGAKVRDGATGKDKKVIRLADHVNRDKSRENKK